MVFEVILEGLKFLNIPLKRGWRYFRLRRYKRNSKRPPISMEAARAYAYATLGGQIEVAIPYQNFKSKRICIAVTYKTDDDSYITKIAVLEEVGESYRVLWREEWSIFEVGLEVEDIDNDGIQEVIIKMFSGGTGAHTVFLIVYSQRDNIAYTITEHTERQILSRPIIPEITIHPEPPSAFKRALEACAIKRGFFQTSPEIEWDDTSNAIARWHRDNGPKPSGKIGVLFYEGSPPFSSSIGATLDDGRILWTSYFKNPLVGYIKDRNKWFIAYSPSNFYDWATSLAHDGKRLWFGVHLLKAIYSFEFDIMQLHKHISIHGTNIVADPSVSFKNGRLYVSDSVSFAKNELDEAVQVLEQSA